MSLIDSKTGKVRKKFTVEELKEKANLMRGYNLIALNCAGSGHAGGTLSIMDIAAALYLDIGSSTEFAVDIGKGLTPNSTSSALYNAFSVGADLKAMIRASTTPTTSTAESDLTFSAQVATTTGNGIVPGTEQFLNFVGYQPAAEETGTFTPTGHCQAVFEEL